jgi:surface protein
MKYMFLGCSSLTSLDLSNFNTSSVTDMYGMFYNCYNLTSLDLSNFDTSKVTDMKSVFHGCSNLITIYTLYNWSIDSVINS